MKADPKKLAGLHRLTELAFEVEVAGMARLKAEEEAVRRQLAGLDTARAARADQLRTGVDAARLAGIDPPWERWIDSRREALMTELSRIRARQAAAQAAFARARGRMDVVSALEKRARAQRR